MRSGKQKLEASSARSTASRGASHLTLVDGESTAAELLYQRLAPTVNRLVWAFLGPDSERDDLVHDIFVRILRGASRVREPERLEDWAARVTLNTIKNEFRRRKFRRFLSLDFRDEGEPKNYHPDFEARELLKRTVHVLERMPVSERVPFTLQLFERTSVEEIARMCGTSERTIKRRLQAARQRFERIARHDPLLVKRLPPDVSQGGDE